MICQRSFPRPSLSLAALILLSVPFLAAARDLPSPLPGHPGNIFVEGQPVVISVPHSPSVWQLLDYDDQPAAEPTAQDGRLQLGSLPVGFYRLRPRDNSSANWISLGVLAPLTAPTPQTSPIALDVAMAWFYPKEKMDAAANLCTLAGVNWVRDRLAWGHLEPRPGEFAADTQYDASAAAQAAAGLQVLQVNHSSPGWANPNHKRFPADLRQTYRFHREMARRWQTQVLAFEPWNEADITVFGGHTGAEMASLQKAAYLGLKAGNPKVVACLNVFAKHRQAQLDDLHDNAAWPYFDTFNLHHYEGFERYPDIYAAFRTVSAGKPLWVSECARPVKWTGNEQLKEPSDPDLRVQAERLPKTFALSLYEGSVATFYFLLPHYVEGQTQFGILRPDLTPRPAYVALAAAGRLLADARPLGRLPGDNSRQAYAFRVNADGQPRELIVAWNDDAASTAAHLALPVPPVALHDHLGRPQPLTNHLQLGSAPLYALLPTGATRSLQLTPPPPAPPRLAGEPSPIVLQALWPEDQVLLEKSAYRITGNQEERLPLYLYNFSDQPVNGTLRVKAPATWQINLPAALELAPGERKELTLRINPANANGPLLGTIRITGEFGPAGNPVLSLRLINPAGATAASLSHADDATRWHPAISGNGPIQLAATNGAITVDAQCQGPDRWAYPTLQLQPEEIPPAATEALGFTFTLMEGSGTFRVIFEEANGSGYVADFMAQPKPGETIQALAFLDSAVHGSWSKPDPNHRLDPDQIRVVKIGANTDSAQLRFSFANLRWIRFAP